MKNYLLLLLLLVAAAACSEHKSCRETAVQYDFALGMLPIADTLTVDSRYRVDYSGKLFDQLQEGYTEEINPLFAVKLNIYRVDTTLLFPVLQAAAGNFEVEDLVSGTFAGRNFERINMHILPNNEKGFTGAIHLIPKVPGWYLIDIIPEEIYPAYRGSNRRCEKIEIVRYRLIDTQDAFGKYYDELQRSSVFKPNTQRMIWVK